MSIYTLISFYMRHFRGYLVYNRLVAVIGYLPHSLVVCGRLCARIRDCVVHSVEFDAFAVVSSLVRPHRVDWQPSFGPLLVHADAIRVVIEVSADVKLPLYCDSLLEEADNVEARAGRGRGYVRVVRALAL